MQFVPSVQLYADQIKLGTNNGGNSTLGYRLVRPDGTTLQAFTTAGVLETGTAANYEAAALTLADNVGPFKEIWGTVSSDFDTTWRNLTGQVGAVQASALTVAGLLDATLASHGVADSVGKALRVARALAAGKKVISGDQLLIFDLDATTLLATLNLAPAGGPYTSQTPG